MSNQDSRRLNEAFLGWLGDQASVDIREAYARYEDVCDKHGDTHWVAFPAFVDVVAGLKYVSYDNATGDVHFLRETFLRALPSFADAGYFAAMGAANERQRKVEACEDGAGSVVKITLHLDTTQNAWMANFHDDPAVLEAFGCPIIPTAFTSRARPEDVLHAIRQLNPTAVVQLAHQEVQNV